MLSNYLKEIKHCVKIKKNKRPMGLIGHLSIMQQLSNALI
jgi:hypothetical protein